MVICDCIEIPAMFPHYVKRRIRVSEQGFLSAHDELDIFGYYLLEGLYFDSKKDIAPATKFNLLSYTEEFDNYYFYKAGIRKKIASKPKQKMSKEFGQLIRSIEKTKLDYRVHVQMKLLDLGGDTRKQLLEYIKSINKKYKKDGNIHDASIFGEHDGGWGITYMIGPNPEDTINRLNDYCV